MKVRANVGTGGKKLESRKLSPLNPKMLQAVVGAVDPPVGGEGGGNAAIDPPVGGGGEGSH